MSLQVGDSIEVRVNAVWKPAVVHDLFGVGDSNYLTAQFPDGKQTKVMIINEYSVWRSPDAPVFA